LIGIQLHKCKLIKINTYIYVIILTAGKILSAGDPDSEMTRIHLALLNQDKTGGVLPGGGSPK
jgi:hypothetical protein